MLNRLIAAFLVSTATLPATARELANVTLDVKGMDCATCPLTVKVVLKKQPGVDEVTMDAHKNTADVKFDPAKMTPERLAKAVTEAGYPASARK